MALYSTPLYATDSLLPTVCREVARYDYAMKTANEMRRENLAALVAKEGSQAAFARLIHKDKNQLNQWLQPPSKPQSRNISDEVAREIEQTCKLVTGWMDHDHTVHSASPTADNPAVGGSYILRPDPVKLSLANELLTIRLAELGEVFDVNSEWELFSYAYAWVTRRDAESMAAFQAAVDRRVKTAGDDGERRAGTSTGRTKVGNGKH